MLRSTALRLPIALTFLALCFAGLPGSTGSSSPAGAQSGSKSDRLGFSATLPVIYDQLGLVTTYGFGWLTPANAMKMGTIGGCDGFYDFGPADELLAIADSLNLRVHGHTLVWHSQTSWCADAYTKTDFRSYIRAVTDHYCGKVDSMDVVNEALGDQPGFRGAEESVWYRLFGGAEYIVTAFRWARHTCPEMKLYYNDYGTEYGVKADEMLGLISTLNEQGLIDGVGFQTHLTMGEFNLEKFGQTLDAVSEMGLEIALSEVDVRFNRNYWDLNAANLDAQGEFFRRLAQLCEERPVCVRFTVWGLDDGHSWVNTWASFGGFQDAPLLFDRQMLPKPAYCIGVRPVFDLPQGACAGV